MKRMILQGLLCSDGLISKAIALNERNVAIREHYYVPLTDSNIPPD